MRFGSLVIGMCLLFALAAGCTDHRTDTTPDKAPAPAVAPGPNPGGAASTADDGAFAAGRKVYVSNGCARCHMINGQGGFAGGPGGPPPGGPPPGGPPPGGPGGFKGKGKGPDLGKVGAKHDADWIAAHVRDPKSHNEKSSMPRYPEAKLIDGDLKALADYLANQK
jgi:mono/diheme cytochrome c family protein